MYRVEEGHHGGRHCVSIACMYSYVSKSICWGRWVDRCNTIYGVPFLDHRVNWWPLSPWEGDCLRINWLIPLLWWCPRSFTSLTSEAFFLCNVCVVLFIFVTVAIIVVQNMEECSTWRAHHLTDGVQKQRHDRRDERDHPEAEWWSISTRGREREEGCKLSFRVCAVSLHFSSSLSLCFLSHLASS